MKNRFFLFIVFLLCGITICQAQNGWQRKYYTDDWGEPMKNHPYIATSETAKDPNTQPDPLGLGIKIDEMGAILMIVTPYSGYDIDRFEPLTIKIKTSQGNVMEIPYDGASTGEILISNETGFKNLLKAISSGSFQISISGHSYVGGSNFKALFKFPNLSGGFSNAWEWFAGHF